MARDNRIRRVDGCVAHLQSVSRKSGPLDCNDVLRSCCIGLLYVCRPSVRVDTRPRKRNSPRIAEKSAPAFLQWLRGRPCAFGLIDGHNCEGKIEAAHLDWAGGKGIATKVADRFSVPMCSGHHRIQHTKGWLTFMRDREVNKTLMQAAADKFWNAWPGRIAWERKVNGDA
jgi:hypothetical protein